MAESEVDSLFELLEKNIQTDNKQAIVGICTRLLGYSHRLDEKTQVSLFVAKGLALLKLQRYTLAILNVKRAIDINTDKNDELGLQALEYVKMRIME